MALSAYSSIGIPRYTAVMFLARVVSGPNAWIARVIGILVLALTPAQTASPSDWPHWRGPNRDGISAEISGFEGANWSLREAWSGNFGDGAGGPSVADGKVFAMGWRASEERVYAADASTGAVVWSVSYPAPRYGRHAVGDQDFYAGPSSTPEMDPKSGYLYTLGID